MRTLVTGTAALSLALALGPAPATAGTSFEFLFSVSHVSDDNQYFLNLAVGEFGYGRAILEPVLPRLRAVEVELPVVLFLARHSGRPIGFIVDLRARGLTWAVIFNQLNVPFDVLFAGIDRDPGPPYGNAWGYWKKNPRAARFSDGDIAGLVSVQIGARFAGLSPLEIARARGKGKKVAVLVAEKKGRPFKAGKPEHASGKGKGHKPDKGHGNN
jgi:hypothetical protein